ncbi:UDP-N-acetylmuramoylalanine--D-glutamate ligase MurD [Thalassoglobus neptunius]|uniref:UDP-N-acetylmuramoylalanine--D-glutamate ligase n=1 Tax=Thalassoglobus neptunius TaxID=1938619 RepID=A0A5C5WPH5_9PLAN|nr:UDP-N-acetylmuramoyl-L-alanine--D-glutamate ligase [Thalassoglobus neptunius]TWT52330.1 UDP-N-acetylmuramoylalanine--D-glutamate ligase MurD [Thalassoglobus neptunius]
MDRGDPSFAGQRVTVMGLGRFGGGIAVVNFLLDSGARVTLTDLQSATALQQSLAQIDVSRLESLVLGEHRLEDFVTADLIVVSPALNPNRNRYTLAAIEQGTPLTSEIEIFWRNCRGSKIVVTGTVGKSTTSTLIHTMLQAAGRAAFLGGNIGVSLLPTVGSIREEDWVVLELSSFQLSQLASTQPIPEITVVTNFRPNHLDWHPSIDDYRQCKEQASRWQTDRQVTILNRDDEALRNWPGAGKRIWFGRSLQESEQGARVAPEGILLQAETGQTMIPFSQLPDRFQYRHLQENLAAALAVTGICLELPPNQLVDGVRRFEPLSHRLEVLSVDGPVTFVNDSKATTPEATIAAVQSMAKPIYLILGGKDKQVDLRPMCEAFSQRVQGVACIGDVGETLADHFRELTPGLPVEVAASLDHAVEWSISRARSGDIVLLSPGCASHSEFYNFEHRGDEFRRIVSELLSR